MLEKKKVLKKYLIKINKLFFWELFMPINLISKMRMLTWNNLKNGKESSGRFKRYRAIIELKWTIYLKQEFFMLRQLETNISSRLLLFMLEDY